MCGGSCSRSDVRNQISAQTGACEDCRSETVVLAGRRQCAGEAAPGQMSEIKSQPKLEPARTAGRERLSKEWPKIRIRPRYPDVGMVENVESICPKLERTGFKDPE